MQGEVTDFYKGQKQHNSETPPHPIGMTAKDQWDALGKSLLPIFFVQSCLLRHLHVRCEPQCSAALYSVVLDGSRSGSETPALLMHVLAQF